MIFAKSSTSVDDRIFATKGSRAVCPMCNDDVIAKCGDVNVHHWAHKSLIDCDDWSEPETDWHIGWKNLFGKGNTEIVIQKNGETHRADAIGIGEVVLEFQHSPISYEVITRRELFYGDDLFWVFDMRSARYRFKRIREHRFTKILDKEEVSNIYFKWSYPRRSLLAVKAPMYFDFGTKKMMSVHRLDATGRGMGMFVDKTSFIEAMARSAEG